MPVVTLAGSGSVVESVIATSTKFVSAAAPVAVILSPVKVTVVPSKETMPGSSSVVVITKSPATFKVLPVSIPIKAVSIVERSDMSLIVSLSMATSFKLLGSSMRTAVT